MISYVHTGKQRNPTLHLSNKTCTNLVAAAILQINFPTFTWGHLVRARRSVDEYASWSLRTLRGDPTLSTWKGANKQTKPKDQTTNPA